MVMSRKKRKGLRLKSFLLMLGCLLLLSGCWDSREIEERSAVAAIAIDKADNGGLTVSVQIPIPLSIAGGTGGGGGGGEVVKVTQATGRTFQDAMEKLQYRVDNKLFFGQTAVIAFGKDMAKSGIQNVVDVLRRMTQIRRLLYPIVMEEGKSSDLLKVKTNLEKIPANFMKSMIENEIRMGSLPDLTLGRFYVGLSNTSRQPIMLSFKMEGKSQIIATGLAVFKNARLIGMLNRQETANMLRVSREDGGGNFTFTVDDNPGHLGTFSPELVNTKYKFSYKKGIVNISIHVFVEGQLTELTFPYDLEKKTNRMKLKETIERSFEKQSKAVIDKLQKQYGSDVLMLGSRLRAFHNDIWKQVDWSEAFPNANIKVNYDVEVRRAGMELKNYRK